MVKVLINPQQSYCYVLHFVTSVKEEAIDFAAAESTLVVTEDNYQNAGSPL